MDTAGAWVSIVVFFLFKPAAYYGFIQAFRYRVSRPIPMTFGQDAKLTVALAVLGVLLFAIGAAIVWAGGRDGLLVWSWLYLYAARAAAWFVVGKWGEVLRGRRLVGWIVSGTLLNGAFDAAVVLGLFAGWQIPVGIMVAIAVSITALHIVGTRSNDRQGGCFFRNILDMEHDLNMKGFCAIAQKRPMFSSNPHQSNQLIRA